MNQLNERQLETHVPIVAWLLIASHALFLLIAGFVFVLLVGLGVAVPEPEATAVLSVVGIAVAGPLGVLSLPGIVAGVGLLQRRGWARVVALIVAALNLPNFPIGTALGLYTGWVLLQDSAGPYFARTATMVD
jgi:hypothetical protein